MVMLFVSMIAQLQLGLHVTFRCVLCCLLYEGTVRSNPFLGGPHMSIVHKGGSNHAHLVVSTISDEIGWTAAVTLRKNDSSYAFPSQRETDLVRITSGSLHADDSPAALP